MTDQPTEPGPAELIVKDGRALHYIAAAAGVSIETVWKARQTNAWPVQHRTRTGLRRALGLDQPALAPAGGQVVPEPPRPAVWAGV